MLQKQVIRAIGGLNRDDDPRYLPEGDYIDMINLRVGSNQEQGDHGLAETFLSHYPIQFPDVTGSLLTPLAVAVDEQRDLAVVLAYYNDTTPYFQLYKFNILTDEIIKIFQVDAEEWNITASTKIYNPRILDGKIIWTENVNPIMYIDIDRIETSYINGIGIDENSIPTKWDSSVEYDEGDFVFYGDSIYKKLYVAEPTSEPTPTPTPTVTPTAEPEITPDQSDEWEYVCKILDCYLNITSIRSLTLSANPPTLALEPEYSNDASRISNNLRNKTFQFTYRYVYIDYRKSTYAPPSIVPPPDGEENLDGTQNAEQRYHNAISLSVYTGNEEIRSIEIVGRSSEDPATWFFVEEIPLFDKDGVRVISPNTTYSTLWYNDVIKQVVDSEEVYSLFTYVPVKAKHMELIDGNRLVFANITEGYNRIQQNVKAVLDYQDLEGISHVKQILTVAQVFVEPWRVNKRLFVILPETPVLGIYYLNITSNTGYLYEASYEYTVGDYPLTVKNGLLASITANGWASEVEICQTPSDYTICFFERTGETVFNEWQYINKSYIEDTGTTSVNKYPTLKTGLTHNWGLIYRDDAGRLSPIIGAGEIKVEIPFPSQSEGQDIQKRPVVSLHIYHLPPEWATSYEVVYLSSNLYFLQLLGYQLSIGRNSEEREDPDGGSDTRFGRISVEYMLTRTREKMPNWSVEQYMFQEGDRIRFIGYSFNDNTIIRYTTYYDIPIHGVFVDTVYKNPSAPGEGTEDMEFIYFQRSGTFPDNETPDITKSYFVEIYRPPKEFSINLYYTTGMTFEVATNAYGDKYHKGTAHESDENDQTLNELGAVTQEAIVENTAHDAWKYLRNFIHPTTEGTSLYIWSESEYASDFYLTSKLTSSGTPVPQLDNYRQLALTKRLRHGGKYNFGTELNLLAKFDYDDFLDMKDEYGDIEGVRELGFILKVIQYTKVTAIYISRIESYAGNSESQFLFTDRVFGSSRPGLEDYGTRHPDSVCVYNNNLYFWDQSEGIIVRDAANGQIPISAYKMISYFRDKAKAMDSVAFANQEVYFGYSMNDNMLYCTFSTGSTFETAVFSEMENRWKFTTDAIIRKPFWLGRRLFHIHNGNIYEWWRDEGQGYLVLSGEIKEGFVTIIANDEPLKNKTFNALAVYQDGDTPVAQLLVPAKASAVSQDMVSIVSQWVQREGIWYGQILRDAYTPGVAFPTMNKYLNGRRLRGQYTQIILRFTNVLSKVRLFHVMLTATPSERSL